MTLEHMAKAIDMVRESLTQPRKEDSMTTTPYDAEIAHYEELVRQANDRGTRGNIWDNEHRLASAKAEGYRRAKTEDAPLLEALKVAERRILEVSVINNVPGSQSQAALGQIRAAIALAEGKEATP